MWHDSICNTVQEPTVTSIIVAKKTTTWGESGFPSEFLGIKPLAEQEFRLADGSKITRKKVARFSSTASSSGLRMSYLVRMETVSC